MLLSVIGFLVTPAHAVPQTHPELKRFAELLKNGGAFVQSSGGDTLLCYRCDDLFIPASTIKVATAFIALEQLGSSYRFETKFYLRGKKTLVVKGFGDPSLTSEELSRIGTKLRSLGISEVDTLVLDDSYFGHSGKVDGQSDSSNPYDALNGALLANYNTIAVRVLQNKSLETLEIQTPLVPVARMLSSKLTPGAHRVNIGNNRELGLRYFGELLYALLKKQAVNYSLADKRSTQDVARTIWPTIEVHGRVRASDELVYTHHSTKTLDKIVAEMLEYSTNLVANQLVLKLGVEQAGEGARIEDGVKFISDRLRTLLGWQKFTLVEGAGLSRINRVSPRNMVLLLKSFAKYRELLPIEADISPAKTGSLTGVNTIIGELKTKQFGRVYYAFLVNSPVPHNYKFTLVRKLNSIIGN